MSKKSNNKSLPGPFAPTLILHGGAGRILRPNLPPSLYEQYKSSLLTYLTSTRELLYSGNANALDAAVHAVSLMEDDPLFNCGRGAVFTEKGTIELEASVMITSVQADADMNGSGGIPATAFQKRGAGVIGITETRHPIQLAREVLMHTAEEVGGVSRHCQLAGKEIEETGFREWGMERAGKEWFWTKKRWDEHMRGLKKKDSSGVGSDVHGLLDDGDDGLCDGDKDLPSQGTVGCVVMDSWGNICAATSTGGLTNKKPGRIGDTPTLGAGFWAESWSQPGQLGINSAMSMGSQVSVSEGPAFSDQFYETFRQDLRNITSCIPFAHSILGLEQRSPVVQQASCPLLSEKQTSDVITQQPGPKSHLGGVSSSTARPVPTVRRAIGISGTGNGDSFLRTCAARTVGALSRFQCKLLKESLPMVAGTLGELQQSAGDRWGTGEGEGGMIGIEAILPLESAVLGQQNAKGEIVWDFNCGGMWRAYWDETKDEGTVMVFREEYGQDGQ